MDLQQGDRTVKEYEIEFNRLAPYAPELVREEGAKARFFTQGLNPHIRRFVMSRQASTFGGAVEMAMAIEKDFLDSRASQSSKDHKKRKGNAKGSNNSNKK